MKTTNRLALAGVPLGTLPCTNINRARWWREHAELRRQMKLRRIRARKKLHAERDTFELSPPRARDEVRVYQPPRFDAPGAA